MSAWTESCHSARNHLRAAIRAFIDHYHEERPHQGLGNELIAAKATSLRPDEVRCRERLGGVLKFHHARPHNPSAEFSHRTPIQRAFTTSSSRRSSGRTRTTFPPSMNT
jgi:hypothetical protein